MKFKFWLLQALGWLPYALLQVLIDSEDQPWHSPRHWLPALLMIGLAVSGSLLLRLIYRRLQSSPIGELRWLASIVLISLSVALAAALCCQALLWLLSLTQLGLAGLHTEQPLLARALPLFFLYLTWSLLYLALSRQQRLQDAAQHQQAMQLALREAQIQRLLGQLSPHFTFNTLNNIRALMLKDVTAARDLITRFASTLRYQFNAAEHALVPIAEELATVRDYLELVRLQLGNRLRYHEQVDPRALQFQMPRFALQLLVENAIKHGLAPRALPGDLSIDIGVQEAGELRVDVRNTGVWVEPFVATGTGLNNLRQRLQLSFASAAGLDVQQDGECVLARLWIDANVCQ